MGSSWYNVNNLKTTNPAIVLPIRSEGLFVQTREELSFRQGQQVFEAFQFDQLIVNNLLDGLLVSLEEHVLCPLSMVSLANGAEGRRCLHSNVLITCDFDFTFLSLYFEDELM